MDYKSKIQTLARQNHKQVISIRRHLHQHPELSFQEQNTSLFIQKQLDEIGIPYKSGYVKTGIVAHIHGQMKSSAKPRVVALRADMDALPIQELGNLPYKSKNQGVMHACGHDVHTASLIGCAMILNDLKSQFSGTVKLIFQPAEEYLPGGAKGMIDQGALNNPEPDIVIGQHVEPELETGTVGFRPGKYMASADEIYLTVKGKGGHGGIPHTISDTVLAASQIIVALQQIVSRKIPASIPAVLSFGRFIAGGATNVIPDEVQMAGTLRMMNEEWRSKTHQYIKDIAEATARAYHVNCLVDNKLGYPFLVNHEQSTLKARNYSSQYLSESAVNDLDIRMTGEDFAYFSQKYPSVFYRLGVKKTGAEEHVSLHSPYFDIDENALQTGMGLMSWLAVSFLKS